MRRTLLALAILASLAAPGRAQAAPVVINAILGVSVRGIAPLTVAGSGIIDVYGSTISVPAGLVSLGSTIVVPVTSTTVIDSLSISKLSNLSATFSLGGVTAQAPGEICSGGPDAGEACNVGGGFGGVMGLTGTLLVNIIPNIVVIPVHLNSALIGQGGSTNQPFVIDAAAWTTGVGLVNTGTQVTATTGSPGGFALNLLLVSPTFVNLVGNALPIVTSLTLTGGGPPLPEPSGLVLVVVGALGLAALRAGPR